VFLVALAASTSAALAGAEAPASNDSRIDAQDIYDTSYEIAARAGELLALATEARQRVVPGWERTATLGELTDSLYELSKLAGAHAATALSNLVDHEDPIGALSELALASFFAQQADVAAASVVAVAGLPPAVPGGASWSDTLPVPDGKYEGWLIPEDALAQADVVRVDPVSAEGEALNRWRSQLDANGKWLAQMVLVDDLYIKDPIVVSQVLAVGPRWLGQGGDILSGQTLHLHNVWVLKAASVYEAVKEPDLMVALQTGGWDAGATAWDCGDGGVFVPAVVESRQVICRAETVLLPAGLTAPDGTNRIRIATDCEIVPEKLGECRPIGATQLPTGSWLTQEDWVEPVSPPPWPTGTYPPLPDPESVDYPATAVSASPNDWCRNGTSDDSLPSMQSPAQPPDVADSIGEPNPQFNPELDAPFAGALVELNPDSDLAAQRIKQVQMQLAAQDGANADGDHVSDDRYRTKQAMWSQWATSP
jgi:hypothetical protein